MSTSGLRVHRQRGEEVRRSLVERGFLDGRRAILHEDQFIVLPLTERALPDPSWGEVVEREFGSPGPSPPADYRELLDWPSDRKALLPRSFDVVGEIVLVRIPSELEGRKAEIGSALLAFVPSARLVGADRGVHGPERRREVERIAGTGPWSTRHRENGIEFDVDLERAYFSPRLAHEHERVAAEVQDGERVFDLCCGVGPFGLSIARAGRAQHILAVDANPAAIALLRSTLRRYPFASRVEPVEERLETFLSHATPRERVILNLPHEGIKYLPSVARAVLPRGRLHYYEVSPRAELERRGKAVIDALGADGRWDVVEHHVVHPYSPTSDLVAFVVERSER
jgi:tRNA (guanine37-N1)-methyltransferase